ncbi:MAG: HAD family hydrolase [Flavobacteriales bacterium]|nr:HAD family hydrolase [Flavobacteriales bacterium]
MQYKVVVCDLDGTLLDSNHSLSDETRFEIKRISDLGVKVILATGRHYVDVKGVAEQLGLDTCVIGSNGTRAYANDGERLIMHNLDESVIDKMMNFDLPDDIHLNIYQGKEWLVVEDNEALLKFHSHSNFVYRKINGIEDLRKSEVNKFYLYSLNIELLQETEQKLIKELADKADVFFSYYSVIEVMPKGISKGLALKELMENRGIKPEEIIAFGDGLNDYEMLSYVGKGLVMKNSDKKLLKLLPDFEIIGSNDENGVAKYIKENIY